MVMKILQERMKIPNWHLDGVDGLSIGTRLRTGIEIS